MNSFSALDSNYRRGRCLIHVDTEGASFKEIIDDRLKVAASLRSFRDERQHLLWWKDRFRDRPARSIVASDIEEAKQELCESISISSSSPPTVYWYLKVPRRSPIGSMFDLG